jgi:glycosyltransferase involved in cell wall biosynthesis
LIAIITEWSVREEGQSSIDSDILFLPLTCGALPDLIWNLNVKTSVLMITWNQRPFVQEALDSVLCQQTGFEFEVVVSDDCSTDGTQEILAEYARLHPERVRLILRPNNLGAVRNFFATYEECRGDYVAILEGDDHWTNSEKLRKQAELLDQDSDIAVCFHPVLQKDGDGVQPDQIIPPLEYQKRRSEFADLVRMNYIPTCSVMFRNRLFGPPPSWLLDLAIGDWPMHLLNARHGSIGMLDEVMAVYRVHGKGIWSGRPKSWRREQEIRILEQVGHSLSGRYTSLARSQAFSRSMGHAWMCFMDSMPQDSKKWLRYLVGKYPGECARTASFWKLAFKLYCPSVYSAVRGATHRMAGR